MSPPESPSSRIIQVSVRCKDDSGFKQRTSAIAPNANSCLCELPRHPDRALRSSAYQEIFNSLTVEYLTLP